MQDPQPKTALPDELNAMVARSQDKGDEIMVGKTKYRGRNPQYQEIKGGGWIKTAKGIPWVRSRD